MECTKPRYVLEWKLFSTQIQMVALIKGKLLLDKCVVGELEDKELIFKN